MSITDFDFNSKSPTIELYHVTTGRKVKIYRKSGFIKGPVRGFDTLQAAMAWAIKVGRKVIMRVVPVSSVYKLPDHHNEFGTAWWTETVPMGRVKCVFSAEGAWSKPDKTTE